MAKIKLTKSAVDAAQAQAQAVELRDTSAPPCSDVPQKKATISSAMKTWASCFVTLNASRPSGWSRALKAAGATHVGTHGIRYHSATDIANSGIPVKVGMTLTAHKTVAMFTRYVHTEDDPVRQAAELVTTRRKRIIHGQPTPVASVNPQLDPIDFCSLINENDLVPD